MRINSFSDYINQIQEGLIKTYDIDLVIQQSYRNLSVIKLPITLSKLPNNTIKLVIQNFNLAINIEEIFKVLNSNFINLFGWFPSYMEMVNLAGMTHQKPYSEKYLIDTYSYLSSISIIYESTFDLESNIPPKLYHLSIQEYEGKISSYGLSPKSKSKMSIHDGRIYVCKDPNDCLNLIPNFTMWYYGKEKVNRKWIIWEIETQNIKKLYQDPNFINRGYYFLDNIPPHQIKIFKREK